MEGANTKQCSTYLLLFQVFFHEQKSEDSQTFGAKSATKYSITDQATSKVA
jgi:hypothetical protein